MTQPPCKNCADRVMGCHGLCKDYNDYLVKHKEEVAMEKATTPAPIYQGLFSGTSPIPGKHRKTKKVTH